MTVAVNVHVDADRDTEDTRVRVRRMFSENVVVCDGAMGTMLHSTGVPLDRALCELNISQPRLVRDLHAAYVAAGAEIIQTNTFNANRMRLVRVGLEDSVVEINIAGARCAREAVEDSGRPVLVAGSVGPALSATWVPRPPGDARASTLREQIAALADWVDLVVLETFGDIESLAQAVDIALDECDLPIVAQLTFGDDGRTLRGEDAVAVAEALGGLDLAALGANCGVGPGALQPVVADLARLATLPISVQPNAGVPRRLGRQVRYVHDTEYFAEAARQFVAAGATVVGGCCGTTPAHVRAIAKAVASLTPTRTLPPIQQPTTATVRPEIVAAEVDHPNRASWPPADQFVVIAGMQPPRGEDIAGFVEYARELEAAGVNALAITEPAPPMARINPVGVCVVLQQSAQVDVLLPVETADHSLAALQADLLGAHALGLRTVVCRTGSPRGVGDYPDPGPLWDVDSVRLIAALSGLNEGIDWRGVPIPDCTEFVIGASVNTSAAELDNELDRAEEKVRAGAHFLVTDPIFDPEEAQEALSALRQRGVRIPVIATLAPFEDARTIERLRHELPEVAQRTTPLAVVTNDGAGPRSELDVAVEIGDKLRTLVSGVTIHLPTPPDPRAIRLIRRLVGPGSGA
ncbi:MAG: bifunctional homocysteine S-methyltransferase/methylenetetrahydrofolate reductase [Streptosporangiales bacterium]|nr:bifunctional homocysteine S-methyltransferase/methylenetetrahydrofolate reductase [Streptosporangiales bacterium]